MSTPSHLTAAVLRSLAREHWEKEIARDFIFWTREDAFISALAFGTGYCQTPAQLGHFTSALYELYRASRGQ